MTRDNDGNVTEEGNPGKNIQPSEVIRCRECGNLVRRVNTQHLQADRCVFKTRGEGVDKENHRREDHPLSVDEYKEKYPDAPVMAPAERRAIAEQNASEEADERRREMMTRRWNGEDLTEIKKSIADKYGVAARTVRHDWESRSKWIGRVFGLEEAEAVVAEALAQKQDVRRRLMRAASRAEHEQEFDDMIKALKAVDQNIDDTIENLSETGMIEGAIDRKEIRVEGSVEHEHSAEDPGEGLDESTLRDLDALTGSDGEEAVVDAEFREVENDA